MDAKWEVALTIGTGVLVALFLAYHQGAGTTAPGMPALPDQPPVPPLDRIARDAANAAGGYNSDNNIPNGFDFSPTYNIVNNLTSTQFNLPPAQLVPLNVVNMSTGSPQCGCSGGSMTPNQSANDAFLKQLAMIAAIPPVQPTSNVTLTVQKQSPFQLTYTDIKTAAGSMVNNLFQYVGVN